MKPKPEGKMSALDAATKVIAEAGESMTSKQMIEAMAVKNYWDQPGRGDTACNALFRLSS